MSKLILPPGANGQDPRSAIAQVLSEHNMAVRTMNEPQRAAMNRIVLATLAANFMVGDAPAEVQRGAAMAALEEVIRREAAGQKNEAVMWTENVRVETTDEMIARLAKAGENG